MAKSIDVKKMREQNPGIGMQDAAKAVDRADQKQPVEVNRFGLTRHNDLVAIACALASNPNSWPEQYSVSTLVSVAENILIEIEQRGK